MRPLRTDIPGAWHHVFNRATARRPLFLRYEHYRYFLACVARAVRRGLLEVHAYCLMRNHFHLLVRSPTGRLSEALQFIETRFSRYLNRQLKRDGALWRGRFQSRRVRTRAYRKALVVYIDSNPVSAGVVARAREFRWGSARRYAASRRPQWLETAWVESVVQARTGRPAGDATAYEVCFPPDVSPDFLAWVERRLAREPRSDGPSGDLLSAEPVHVRSWLRRKAALADGAPDGPPPACPAVVHHVILERRQSRGPFVLDRSTKKLDGWELLEAGLLRDGCNLTFREIGARHGRPLTTIASRHDTHRQLVRDDARYAEAAVEVLSEAIRRTLDPRRHPTS